VKAVSPRLAGPGAVAAAAGFLLARLVPDVHGKPLFEDEAVAGLIGARPLGEILVTTIWERGGAPLHFVLTHVAFVFNTSPAALRWLSVVFAVATLPLCYDLGRRLGGDAAGAAAAAVAAGSGMLAVYGSFGRMYALFAFVAALAADLFVRALEQRTAGAALAAAAAAWLLPAVHPYGGIVLAVEALLAVVLWRGRPLRPALPVAAVVLAAVPFAIADLRLAERFEVSSEARGRLATPHEAWTQLESAVRGFGGGEGILVLAFLAFAITGAVVIARRHPAFVALAVIALVTPPLLSILVRTGRAPDLSPRHLIFGLPFWAAFVGVGVTWAAANFGSRWRPVAVAAIAVIAALAPQGIVDPRSITYTARLGTEDALSAAAEWLRVRVDPGDVLYPYSSVYLAALPQTGKAVGLPRGQARSLLDAARRVDYPAHHLFVAVPTGATSVRVAPIRRRFGTVVEFRQFGSWLLIRLNGPFKDEAAILAAIDRALAAVVPAPTAQVPKVLSDWFLLNSDVLCEALRNLDAKCVRQP
jgi:hypothetical protein